MAEYKFYLKDKNSTRPTPIRLHIHYANMVCKLYVGEKINPVYWKETKKGSNIFRASKDHPNHETVNSRLKDIETTADDVYVTYKRKHHEEPTPDVLKTLIRQELGLEREENISLLTYFQDVIDDKLKAADREGRNKRNSVIPSYENTLFVLKEFQRRCQYRVNWDSVNMKFYNRFMDYMKAKGLKANTRGLRIKYLKAVLRKATASGINTNLAFTDPAFKAVSEDVDSIYLDETELFDLHSLELNEYQSRVRDLFLITAWTGLRISDVKRITRDNIRGNYIHITTQKTGAGVVIPVHPVVEDIFRKYDYRLPTYTEQHLNRELREIGPKLAEKTQARVLGSRGLDTSKYGQIRLHTGRGSFCTNMYRRGMKPATIMKISGHKTESEFFRYIKITPDEHAQVLQKSFEKDRELYSNGTNLKMR